MMQSVLRRPQRIRRPATSLLWSSAGWAEEAGLEIRPQGRSRITGLLYLRNGSAGHSGFRIVSKRSSHYFTRDRTLHDGFSYHRIQRMSIRVGPIAGLNGDVKFFELSGAWNTRRGIHRCRHAHLGDRRKRDKQDKQDNCRACKHRPHGHAWRQGERHLHIQRATGRCHLTCPNDVQARFVAGRPQSY